MNVRLVKQPRKTAIIKGKYHLSQRTLTEMKDNPRDKLQRLQVSLDRRQFSLSNFDGFLGHRKINKVYYSQGVCVCVCTNACRLPYTCTLNLQSLRCREIKLTFTNAHFLLIYRYYLPKFTRKYHLHLYSKKCFKEANHLLSQDWSDHYICPS